MNTKLALQTLVWSLFVVPSQGASFTVWNTNDVGPGSFRQAIVDANASPGSDVINFDIDASGPYIIQPATQLSQVRSSVIIDGRTQPGFSNKPIIELNGSLLARTNLGLHLSGGNSVLQGLVLNGFPGDAVTVTGPGSTVIRGNFIGTDRDGINAVRNGGAVALYSSNNVVGGTNAMDRNIISGNSSAILLVGAGNRIQGNFIGTDWTGKHLLPNSFLTVYILDAWNNIIGGPAPEMRNIVAGSGFWLSGGTSNLIQGNFMGTDVSGTISLGGYNDWIYIWNGATRNIIADNVLSGGVRSGVYSDRSAGPSNVIRANIIGADITGAAMPNGEHGILLRETSGQVIGGTAAGEGNLIAFNMRNGVRIEGGVQPAVNNSVRGNRLFANGQLAIDLGGNGPTGNDAGDGDSGANNLQNYPQISTAVTNADGTVTLSGTIDTMPNTIIALDFFAATAGRGEGEFYLGTTNINIDANGCGKFFATFNVPAGKSRV